MQGLLTKTIPMFTLISRTFANSPAERDIDDAWVVVDDAKRAKTVPKTPHLAIGHVLTEVDVAAALGNSTAYSGYDPALSGWVGCLPAGWRANIAVGGADSIADATLRVIRIGEWYYVVRHEPVVTGTMTEFTHVTVLVWKVLDFNVSLDNACSAASKLLRTTVC